MSKIKQSSNKQPNQSKQNIKKDFKEFFIVQTGTSVIKQGQFQQVSSVQASSSDNDFKNQSDEQQQRGIKTSQFWSGIKFIKDAPKPSENSVQWNITCPFSFGFNSLGRDNILYIDGLICKAVGCVLIFNSQIYNKHNKKITTLSFNNKTLQLLSGTQSPIPQVFIWQYDAQSRDLQFMRRFSIGSKSQDIYSVQFYLNDFIVAVQIFKLHKNSVLHCFTKIDGKKICSLKVGKFYDLELLSIQPNNQKLNQNQSQITNQRLFFANDDGIFELVYKKQDDNLPIFKTQNIHQTDNLTCLLPFYQNKNLQIMYGDKEGNLKLVFCKQTLKIHDGWIFQLKHHEHNQKNYFFGLGAMDFQLSVVQYSNKKLTTIRKLHMSGYGRSIESYHDLLLIGKRDGDYSEFSLQELIEQKNDNKIIRKQSLSLKCFQGKQNSRIFFIQIDKYSNNNNDKSTELSKYFIYGHSKNKAITFFTIQNSNLKDLKQYILRSYPQALDYKQNVLSYIYAVQKDQNGESQSTEFSKTSKYKDKMVRKFILVVEDVQNKSALIKIPFQMQVQRKIDQLSFIVKFSLNGKYLTVGDQQGNLYILQIGKQISKQLIKFQKKLHKQRISQIIWSKDQKHLKTISQSQMYYWEIIKDINQKLTKIKVNQVKPMQVSEVLWSCLSKFGWQTKNIWDQTDYVNAIYKFWEQEHTIMEVIEKKPNKQVSSYKQKLIGCVMNDGYLRIYNYPAKATKKQQIRINNSIFEVLPYQSKDNQFSFLVLIEGILMLVQLTKD